MLDYDDYESGTRDLEEVVLIPDEEFEDQCGYWLVIMLRGKSIGRQLKRAVFKMTFFYHTLTAGSLFLVTCFEDAYFGWTSYFSHYRNGSSLLGIQYGISILALLQASANFYAIKHWASLTTNRDLLAKFLQIYQGFILLYFILTLASIIKVFQTFENVSWYSNNTTEDILPCYVITIILQLIYILALVYYGLDLSFLTEQMQYGGSIEEPPPQPDFIMDMRGVTLVQLFGVLIAIPIMLFETFSEYFFDSLDYCLRQNKEVHRKYEKHMKRARTFGHRISKTARRMGRSFVSFFAPSPQSIRIPAPAAAPAETLPLTGLVNNSPQKELERRRALEEEIRRKQLQEEEESRQAEERKRLEEEAKRVPVLDTKGFKALWTSLPSAGSFQCKLKSVADKEKFLTHIKKQGFHVVFFANPGGENSFEIGLCNTRESGEGPWFLARFVTMDKKFSAVMKAEDTAIVTGFVKKFGLAKVLRIDTSAA